MTSASSLRIRALSAVAGCALALCACGKSGDKSGDSSSGPTKGAAAAISGDPLQGYTGPESKFPRSYPAPVVKAGVKCSIGYLNFSNAIDAYRLEQNSAEKEAKRLHCKFVPKDAQSDVDTQVSQFSQLLAQKVDAIVMYAINPSSMGPSLAQAKAKGIPVIGQDSPPDSSQPPVAAYTSTVLFGRDLATYLLANQIAKADKGASVAFLGTAQPIASARYQSSRFEYWSKKLGLKWEGETTAQSLESSDVANGMSALLAKHPDVKFVYCVNDPAAVAAAAQARSSGNTTVRTTGLSGTEAAFAAIKSGQMFASYRTDLENIGKQTVDGAYHALTKDGVKLPTRILRPGPVVTSANVDSLTPVRAGG